MWAYRLYLLPYFENNWKSSLPKFSGSRVKFSGSPVIVPSVHIRLLFSRILLRHVQLGLDMVVFNKFFVDTKFFTTFLMDAAILIYWPIKNVVTEASGRDGRKQLHEAFRILHINWSTKGTFSYIKIVDILILTQLLLGIIEISHMY